MENILVSSCLLGNNTKYNGGNNYVDGILKLKDKYNIIPICPEVFGGLSTPRIPSEIKGSVVINKENLDVTHNFNLGALKALELAKKYNCKIAVLKESSPSCGSNMIYDGTFSGNKIKGMGVTAKLFKENNIIIYTEKNFLELLK